MIKIKLFSSLLFTMLFVCSLQADPGDTIIVKTFEFEGYPIGSGWLSAREGHFDFTSIDGLNFEKVLLKYTLKCDNTQNPACGEWDYISYINLIEHTGIGNYPNYLIGGEGGYKPAEFEYMNDVSWRYESRKEETITFDDPIAALEIEIGDDNIVLTDVFNTSLSDARNLFMYKASELLDAGLSAGDITGIQFDVDAKGGGMKRLNIQMKQTTDSELSEVTKTDGFTNVYSKDTEFEAAGWQNLNFTSFFQWDGTSNIIFDIYYSGTEDDDGTTILGSPTSWNSASSASNVDHYFDFNGPDKILIPIDNLSDLNEEITISFWLNGNNEQPQNDSAFEARDAEGNRVLNAHLPWSNGSIYWDAAGDRIDKASNYAGQYKGRWNHWAFTKNAGTGKMRIYLNGLLWHSGSGKSNNIGAISQFAIGRGLWNANNFYDGKMDEFRIWSKELDAATIVEWMKKDIDSTHINYDDLIAYYKFDETEGYTTKDEVSDNYANLKGAPQRMDYDGKRFKSFERSAVRPNIKLNRNSSNYTINTVYVIDSFPLGEILIEKYSQIQAGQKPILDEIIHAYPTYYTYVFNENGVAIDSNLVAADEKIVFELIPYNTSVAGEEITTPLEIGRFITPYGNGLSLDDDGWTWIFDVTDFQNYFKGDDVHMKAGNFQELLDIDVLFIEGTPPRDVLKIQNLYSVNPQLKDFDNIVVDTIVDLLADAKMFKLKTTVSGHWFGEGNNCGEFCSNFHSVEINGNSEYSWNIIQECGENPLFPQGGTWFYDRAGWCPGMKVTERNLEVTPFVNVGVDTQVTLDYDIQYDPYGNYVTEINFVSYGAPHFTNDASIEEIIAPNKFKLNGRFNPICGGPIVKIKNTGSDVLTSLMITYGMVGQDPYTYKWNGNLAFLEETIVSLPTIDFDDYYDTNSKSFYAQISSPNEIADEYEPNNYNQSSFELAPRYEQQQIIWFKTNSRPWENRYAVYDVDGNVVFSRNNLGANTTYRDTLDLSPGCYEFIAYDTAGDGMYNWPSNAGTGSIKLRNLDNSFSVELENWFGESVSHKFVNTAFPVGQEEREIVSFKIWPNPSEGIFNIEYKESNPEFDVEVYDIAGKKVFHKHLNRSLSGIFTLDLSHLESGFYLMDVKSDKVNTAQKIIIEK